MFNMYAMERTQVSRSLSDRKSVVRPKAGRGMIPIYSPESEAAVDEFVAALAVVLARRDHQKWLDEQGNKKLGRPRKSGKPSVRKN